jgi:precorrin-6B methylase 2
MQFEVGEEENPFHIGIWLDGDSLAPPCQTDKDVIKAILELANPTEDSVLMDLGCGDGRICLTASLQYKCKSIGVEIEQPLVQKFQNSILSCQLEDLAQAVSGDLLNVELSQATILVLYLLPAAIDQLQEKLIEALRKNDKLVIICNTWGIKALRVVEKISCGYLNNVTLFKYNNQSLQPASSII